MVLMMGALPQLLAEKSLSLSQINISSVFESYTSRMEDSFSMQSVAELQELSQI